MWAASARRHTMCCWLIPPTSPPTPTRPASRSRSVFICGPRSEQPCARDDAADAGECPAQPREWASWQIAQKFFIDPNFGGALITGRRNVFDSTLDMSAVAFLTSPRNLAPITSRLRFEAIDNLRIQWDLDYDPKAGPTERRQPVCRLQLGPHHGGHWSRPAERRGRKPRLRLHHQEPAVAAISRHRQAQRRWLQLCGEWRLRLCPWAVAIRRRAGQLQLGLLRSHRRLPALPARFGARRNPVPLQLYAGELRVSGRHSPLQLGLPRPHRAAGLLSLCACLSLPRRVHSLSSGNCPSV